MNELKQQGTSISDVKTKKAETFKLLNGYLMLVKDTLTLTLRI